MNKFMTTIALIALTLCLAGTASAQQYWIPYGYSPYYNYSFRQQYNWHLQRQFNNAIRSRNMPQQSQPQRQEVHIYKHPTRTDNFDRRAYKPATRFGVDWSKRY